MVHYLITAGEPLGFTAEVAHPDGVIEIKTGFLTKTLALAWVSEKLIVSAGQELFGPGF
jgi:hypothetical protein